jgi:hypothetical protein
MRRLLLGFQGRILNDDFFGIELSDIVVGQTELVQDLFVVLTQKVRLQFGLIRPRGKSHRVTRDSERTYLGVVDPPDGSTFDQMGLRHGLVQREHGSAGYALVFQSRNGGVPGRERFQPSLKNLGD